MKVFLRAALSVLMGLGVCLVLAACLGENPVDVLWVLLRGAFGNATSIGYTIYYATPLIFTGLSVALAFQCGLFNIGAEGQLHMGALFMTAAALALPGLSPWVAVPLCFLACLLGGGVWGAFAGALKAYRGSHEVLVTIMLNFISYGVLGFFVFNVLKNPDSPAPETYPLSSAYDIGHLPWLGGSSPANYTFLIAVAIALALQFVLSRTVWGYQIRLVGAAPETARRAGVPMKKRLIEALAVSGALAGLVGLNEVLGFAHKLREGFSSGFGFVGIAVALVGRSRPLGVVAAALLFGALHKGSLDLDLDTKYITRDLAAVMQAVVILFAVFDEFWGRLFTRAKRGAA